MATGVASGLRDDVLAEARALAGAEQREQRRILDRIAERLAADVGDVCCIALLRDGRLDPVALGHRDRAARRLLTELVRLPLGLSAVPAATIVMVTQTPIGPTQRRTRRCCWSSPIPSRRALAHVPWADHDLGDL